MSVNTRKPTGSGRLISPNQLDFAQQPGTGETATVRVTNAGASPETYTPSLRTLGAKLSDIKADINVTPATDPTFTDYKGIPQGYQKVTFTVPAGAQRLDAAIAHPGAGTRAEHDAVRPRRTSRRVHVPERRRAVQLRAHRRARARRPAPGPR